MTGGSLRWAGVTSWSAIGVHERSMPAAGWSSPALSTRHIHMSGDPERWVDLAGLESMSELKAQVTRKAEQLGSGEWITGYGWSEDELAEQRRPFRWDLDDAAPVNPVVITRAGGHSSVANSLALEIAELTSESEGLSRWMRTAR